MRGLVMVLLVVSGAAGLAGCFTCYDCGPCGIMGGPNQSYELIAIVGVDSRQRLITELAAGAPGDCGAPNRFWLDGDGNFGAAPAAERLTFNGVGTGPSDGGERTSVSIHGLTTVTLDRDNATTTTVTFHTEGTNTQTVPEKRLSRTCSTTDGLTVTCVEVQPK